MFFWLLKKKLFSAFLRTFSIQLTVFSLCLQDHVQAKEVQNSLGAMAEVRAVLPLTQRWKISLREAPRKQKRSGKVAAIWKKSGSL